MDERPNKRELLVYGYIRNIETQYKHLNPIPIENNNIIYLYQRLCDEWSEKYKSKHVTISHQGIVSINHGADLSIYGKEAVTRGVFIWIVKIIEFNGHPGSDLPYIGMVMSI